MKTILCPNCNERILILPDTVAMVVAIEKHIKKHKDLQNHKEKENLESCLIGKVFMEITR